MVFGIAGATRAGRGGAHWARLMLLWVGAVLVSACLSLDGGSGDGSGGPGTIAGDWPLTPPSKTTLEPGARLTVKARKVDVPLDDVVLWVNDVPLLDAKTKVVEEGPDVDSNADDVVELAANLPLMRAGSYSITFGTEDVEHTGVVGITIVIPERRRPREEVGAAMGQGIGALATSVGDWLLDPAPEYQAFLQDVYGAEQGALQSVLATLPGLGQAATQEYAGLSDADERAMQALLHNTGVLGFFDNLGAGGVSADWVGGGGGGGGGVGQTQQAQVITLRDRLTHPVHRALYALDFMAMGLHVAGDAVDLVNLAAVLTGGVALSVSVPMTLAVGVLKFVIDGFVPTDLYELAPHDQKRMVVKKQSTWVYWGTFRPQDPLPDIATSSFKTAFSTMLSGLIAQSKISERLLKLVPKAEKEKVVDHVLNVLQKFVETGAGKVLEGDFNKLATRAAWLSEVKLQLNMSAYNLTIGDLAALIPGIGLALKSTSWLIDFEIASPVAADTSSAASFMKDATASMDYADDQLLITGVTFPPGTTEASLTILATGYRWKQKSLLWAFNRPGFDATTHAHGVVLEPDLNAGVGIHRDHSLVVNVLPDPAKLVVTRDTAKDRSYAAEITALTSGPKDMQPVVTVKVNGVPQAVDVQLNSVQAAPLTLALAPGENTVAVVGISGADPSVNPNDAACKVRLPAAMNDVPEKLLELSVGQELSFRVFTPPAVE